MRRPCATVFAAILWIAWLPPTLAQETAQETPAAEILALTAKPMTGPRAGVAALLLSGSDGGALWAAALARPRGGADGDSGVDFWFELDGSRLLELFDPLSDSLRLEFHAYAMTASGELAGNLSRRIRLPLAEVGEVMRTRGVKLFGGFHLPPGAYQLRMMVREPASQRFALRVLRFTVPSSSGPFLSSPHVPEVAGAWIPVDVGGAGGLPGAHPPAALPVFMVAGEPSLQFEGQGLTDVQPTLRLLDAQGEAVEGLELDLSTAAGRGAWEVRLQLPEVPTGPYALEVAGVGSTQASTLPVHVLPIYVLGADVALPTAEHAALPWTAIRRLALQPKDPGQRLALAEQRRSAERVAVVASAYRDILGELASGATDRATIALKRLEEEVLGDEKQRLQGRDWLSTAQRQVGKSLLAEDPESLVPLLLLHLEMHERYLEAGADPFLSSAARERVLELAAGYSDRARTELAPALAAAALAEAGFAVDRAGLPQTGRQLLEEALALDDGNPAVQLYLAFWYERQGLHRRAVEMLRRLLEVEPRSEEGWLRLALNLQRQGQEEEAVRWFARVLRESSTQWMLAIAYQEEARRLLAADRVEEAVRRLEAGVARLPGEQQLHLYLAYALERAGTRRRVREVIANMPSDPVRASPRHLYGQPPGSEEERSKAMLRNHGMARLPLLATALVATGEER